MYLASRFTARNVPLLLSGKKRTFLPPSAGKTLGSLNQSAPFYFTHFHYDD